MGRRGILLILLLILIVGGLFYFSGQAEPVAVQTIEEPVNVAPDGDGGAATDEQ